MDKLKNGKKILVCSRPAGAGGLPFEKIEDSGAVFISSLGHMEIKRRPANRGTTIIERLQLQFACRQGSVTYFSR